MILITASVLIGCLLLMICLLWFMSPGKPRVVCDDNGNKFPAGISEKIFLDINGQRQGMFIRSTDSTLPVLLYLHGGMPDYFLTQRYPTGLEKIFTVVWWEQRGSGISCEPDKSKEIITSEIMIRDAQELTLYLCDRFKKEKIYLMGHSGGTYLGIQLAARYPGLYHASIGVAQITDQLNSEILAREYMITEYRSRGKTSMVRKLESATVSREQGCSGAYLAIRDKAMHELGVGTTREMRSVFTGIFLESLLCREYTLPEKYRLWKGKSRSGVSQLWNEMLNVNLADSLLHFDIPLYFLHGIHDYTVSYPLARNYLVKLQAPVKGFYTFQNSAHSPLFEEAEKTLEILRNDVLQQKADFRDTVNGR